MNQLLGWLKGGDLRSDGLSERVVDVILAQPQLFADLIEGLDVEDDVVRGRTADALEKIGRTRPDLLLGYLPRLLSASRTDPVPMVKMHLAMAFGHLALYQDQREDLVAALLELSQDASVFAASWAITSLCIFGRKYPAVRDQILDQIGSLQGHRSVAIRSKVRKALQLLLTEKTPFPKGWIKSEFLNGL